MTVWIIVVLGLVAAIGLWIYSARRTRQSLPRNLTKRQAGPPPAPPPIAEVSLEEVQASPSGAVEAPPRREDSQEIARPPTAPISTRPPPKDEVAALRKGLASTRSGFISRLAKLFGGKPQLDPAVFDEMEEILVTSDVGVKTSQKILEKLRDKMSRQEIPNTDALWQALRAEVKAILGKPRIGLDLSQKPAVILVVGVNGVGKTTTIGKLASRLHQEGKTVILAAGDTFRAAAVLQLEVWGRRVGCEVVKGPERADPSAVIFDAIKKARDQGIDVVLADTAGRLHTKAPLMEELKKVGRTVEKALDGRGADEILLILDSTTGQNAIQQAQMFKEALPVSGIVLTKLDGTAKGGVIIGIVDEHGIPVRYVGIGERVEDLREFRTEAFVQALFVEPEDGAHAEDSLIAHDST